MVTIVFQITFRAEKHANNVFSFLKNIFDINTLKRSNKYKPHSILIKKKFKIYQNAASGKSSHHLSRKEKYASQGTKKRTVKIKD